MPPVAKPKRQWREAHVWEFLEVLAVHPPIGRKSQDAKMKLGGATVCIWEPIAKAMNVRMKKINEDIITKNPAEVGKLKESVDAAACKSKYDLMAKTFRNTTTKLGLHSTQQKGTSGKDTLEGDHGSNQKQLDAGDREWKFYSRWHSLFGACARNQVHERKTETLTPIKKADTTDVANAGACAGPSKLAEAPEEGRPKRAAAQAATVASEIAAALSDEEELDEGCSGVDSDMDKDEPYEMTEDKGEPEARKPPKRGVKDPKKEPKNENSTDEGGERKKSRISARHQQLASLVGDAKKDAAEKQADALRALVAAHAEGSFKAAQQIAEATRLSAATKAAVEREKLAQVAQEATFKQAMTLAEGINEPGMTFQEKMLAAAELAMEMQAVTARKKPSASSSGVENFGEVAPTNTAT